MADFQELKKKFQIFFVLLIILTFFCVFVCVCLLLVNKINFNLNQ